MTAIFLQVTADMQQQRDVTNRGDEKEEHGTNANGNREKGRDRQSRGRITVAFEIFSDIIPFTGIVFLHEIDGIQSKSIDRLARCVGEK